MTDGTALPYMLRTRLNAAEAAHAADAARAFSKSTHGAADQLWTHCSATLLHTTPMFLKTHHSRAGLDRLHPSSTTRSPFPSSARTIWIAAAHVHIMSFPRHALPSFPRCSQALPTQQPPLPTLAEG